MLIQATILTLAQQCAPNVAPHTMATLVAAESSGNPYAIGVVGMQLVKQPTNEKEALALAQSLLDQGANISVGLGQVNKNNFKGLGLTLEKAFDPCTNLTASSKVLTNCYERAVASKGEGQEALQAAFSCYYSNNFTRGFVKESENRPSYLMHIASNSEKLRPVPAIEFKPADVKEIDPGKRIEAQPAAQPAQALEEAAPEAKQEAKQERNPEKERAMSWDVLGDFN